MVDTCIHYRSTILQMEFFHWFRGATIPTKLYLFNSIVVSSVTPTDLHMHYTCIYINMVIAWTALHVKPMKHGHMTGPLHLRRWPIQGKGQKREIQRKARKREGKYTCWDGRGWDSACLLVCLQPWENGTTVWAGKVIPTTSK